MNEHARFIVGIDLGTTHCSVAYIDTDPVKNPSFGVVNFPLIQLMKEGVSQAASLLPSSLYLASLREFDPAQLKLPWADIDPYTVVGSFALDLGSLVPTRFVHSAKSWLSHSAAASKERFLPLDAANDERRVSPIDASAALLRHICLCWNHRWAKEDPTLTLDQQEVIITVPASFDEIARLSTATAAQMAGLSNITLLEEPQAAFYHFLLEKSKIYHSLKEGDTILVCDVGGGTTDFSLIEVVTGKDGEFGFERMSVGHHLLLGGDNMDMSLAHQLQDGQAFNSKQWTQLCLQVRRAKERLLSGSTSEASIVVQGEGSSVIKGSKTYTLSDSFVQNHLVGGFFREVALQEAKSERAIGLSSMALPYEKEPNILWHLAHFLQKADVSKPIHSVLFNGGVFKPPIFRQKVLQSLQNWYGHMPSELTHSSLELAVCRGSAYYGKARRGLAVRIKAGTPCAYYLLVAHEDTKTLLTVMAKGTEEGTSFVCPHIFHAKANQLVAFHLFKSHTRLKDQVGQIIPFNDSDFYPLHPVQTSLLYGKEKNKEANDQIEVELFITLTLMGTLELSLKALNTSHRWALNFQLRGQEELNLKHKPSRMDQTYDEKELTYAQEQLRTHFSSSQDPEGVIKKLQDAFKEPKEQWSITLIRALSDTLLTLAPVRSSSLLHEERFWNLLGFFMRPGRGYPLDDFRIKAIWRLILSETHKKIEANLQNLICWRRIASGLLKGQQQQLASYLMPSVMGWLQTNRKANDQVQIERLRTLASFERLSIASKIKLGELLVTQICKERALAIDYWALSRIGLRNLLYGSSLDVIPSEVSWTWIQKLMTLEMDEKLLVLIEHLARKTPLRELNLKTEHLKELQNTLKIDLEDKEPLQEESSHESWLYADTLPVGLVLKGMS